MYDLPLSPVAPLMAPPSVGESALILEAARLAAVDISLATRSCRLCRIDAILGYWKHDARSLRSLSSSSSSSSP